MNTDSKENAPKPKECVKLHAPTALMLIEAIRDIVRGQKGPCTWEIDKYGSGCIFVYDEHGDTIGQISSEKA